MRERVYYAVGVDGEAVGYLKVGLSKRPRERMSQFRRQGMGPDGRFELVSHIPGSYALERSIHRFLEAKGACAREYGREFFRLDKSILDVERIFLEYRDQFSAVSTLRAGDLTSDGEAPHYRARRLAMEWALVEARLRSYFRSKARMAKGAK